MKWFKTGLCLAGIGGVIVATGAPTSGPAEQPQLSRSDGRLVAPAQLGPSAPRYPSSNTDGQAGSGGRATVYRSGGRVVTAPDLVATAPEALLWRTSYGSWEPTIGVTDSGAVFFSARNANVDPGVARSRDGGRTWEPAGPPEHRVSLDPYVWVDRPTGRVFASDVDPTIACSPVSVSDDEGATWKTSRACGVTDHQSLFGGPPVAGQPGPTGYDHVLYYCAIGKGATTVAPTEAGCLRSLDGGTTWSPSGDPAFPPRVEGASRCGGFHGHGTVGPDGTAYLPSGWCGRPHLAISHDHGRTWEQVQVSDLPARSHEAGISADAEGNLYYVWVSSDEHPYLVTSRDGGKTWSKAQDITPPGVTRMGSFAASLDVGDPGRIAAVFMGTNDPKPHDETTVWNAYVVTSQDALADDPVFYGTTINDPETNALHRGSSCCGNVGDFIDVTIGPEGTAWAALVDTCTEGDECVYSDAGLVTEPRGEGIVGQVVGGPPLVGEIADQRARVALPGARRSACLPARAVKLRIRQPRRGRATSAVIRVDGRAVQTVRGARLGRAVRVRGLTAGRHRVQVTVRTTAGRAVTSRRTYQICG